MCLYPKLIENPKYKPNKKNGGHPPKWKDERVRAVPIGCGKCIECMNQKKREWQVRLHEEIKDRKDGLFITLTFSEEELLKLSDELETQESNEIASIAVRRFTERWRKKYKKTIRHWLITELGHQNTERLHLHGILFTEHKDDIEKIWAYGGIYIGDYVNAKTINYIVKYVTKLDHDHEGYQPKVFASKGIGKGYFNRIDSNSNIFKGEKTNETYRLPNGTRINMPKYYRNKIYNEDEREELWINLIKKNKRYVRGQEIDISTKKGERQYFRAMMYQQKINERLGYGSDEWQKKKYIASRKLLEKNLDI